MPKPFPRVVESQRNRQKFYEWSKRDFCRREVAAADPIHSGAGCESRQSHRQPRVAGLLPIALAGRRDAMKPDYKNLVLLKPSVVEGEGMGSGVARQHGGTVFTMFMRILSAKCSEQATPVL